MCALGSRWRHVGRLDVAVDLALRVQVLQPHEHLVHDRRDVRLRQRHVPHQVEHRAAADILHDDPEARARDVRAVVTRDVRRVALRHDGDLLLDVVDLVLGLLEVNDLDRDDALRCVLDPPVHNPEGAGSYLLQYGKSLFGPVGSGITQPMHVASSGRSL